MNPLLAYVAPIVMLLPGAVAVDEARGAAAAASPAISAPEQVELAERRGPMSLPEGYEPTPWQAFAAAFEGLVQHQVRMEQTLIIRVAPRAPAAPPVMLADLPQPGRPTRLEERRMGRCVAMSGIAGVQYGGDRRLILFMRDQRLVAANLESACRARDYYSGFYVARNSDGMLCSERDQIQSRSGANCRIDGFRQIVDADD